MAPRSARVRLPGPVVLGMLLVVVGASACGDPPPPETAGWVGVPTAQGGAWEDWWNPDFISPHVRHARWLRAGADLLPIGLVHGGDLVLRGHVWHLASGDDEERRATLARLDEILDEPCAHPESSLEEGTCRPALLLFAERDIRWDHVHALLARVLATQDGFSRLAWSVRRPGVRKQLVHEGRLEMLDEVPLETPLGITLTGRWAGRLGGQPTIQLRIGERVWSATPDPAEEPVAAAARWRGARDHVTTEAVEVRIPAPAEGLRWHDVVGLFDLLLGAGVRQVVMPELGLRLHLPPHDDLQALELGQHDDPVATPLVLLLAAALALLGALVTWAPLLGGRRRRPRKEGPADAAITAAPPTPGPPGGGAAR